MSKIVTEKGKFFSYSPALCKWKYSCDEVSMANIIKLDNISEPYNTNGVCKWEILNCPTLQVRHMDRYTKLSHKGQPAQEPALLYAQTTPYGATQTHIIDDREDRVCVQRGLAIWWLDVVSFIILSLSAAVSADVILLGFCLLASSFVFLLGCGSGRFSNSTTSPSRGRCR